MHSNTFPLTLFYDSACPLCDGEMHNLMLRNTEGRLRFVDIAAPGFNGHPPGTTQAQLMALMHGLCADGRVLRGVEVFRLAYGAVGIPQVAAITGLPLLAPLSERLYAFVARHRYLVPHGLSELVFGTALRRAAERAAARGSCRDGTCRVDEAGGC
ncbi:thiol-disulfide oxidoreductase DCC family protein [Pelomonas sp. KK5]|uniref:thiol-disulfide oxidoreductase DCC family protein n=1 Tax=Pelomonas sp. KK5 TaxID=1855730 RepID=UPI00097C6E60|nr:DUF393 domain-containing protein [Pelomonas sp. KK5]